MGKFFIFFSAMTNWANPLSKSLFTTTAVHFSHSYLVSLFFGHLADNQLFIYSAEYTSISADIQGGLRNESIFQDRDSQCLL